jgi:cysteine desulfurase
MRPFFEERFGNPSSVHEIGRDARTALDEARTSIAGRLNTESPAEVLFVSCATEANTLALRGTVNASDRDTVQVITTQIEHPSVLETCQALEDDGKVDVHYLSVDKDARVNPDELRDVITEDTALVSVMTANNEVGTIQPMEEISAICDEYDVLLHTDAVQVPSKAPLDVQDPSVDLLSLSAHKFHGPRGIGLLYKSKHVDLEPVLRGGGQESELRSGTEPVALAAGMSAALDRAMNQREETIREISRLRQRLWNGLSDHFGDQVYLNTPLESSLKNTLNVSFLHNKSDKMLINLDLEGICVSAGSACHSGAIEISHVLDAMDVPRDVAESSVRFSLSHENTKRDIDKTLDCLTSEKARVQNP